MVHMMSLRIQKLYLLNDQARCDGNGLVDLTEVQKDMWGG